MAPVGRLPQAAHRPFAQLDDESDRDLKSSSSSRDGDGYRRPKKFGIDEKFYVKVQGGGPNMPLMIYDETRQCSFSYSMTLLMMQDLSIFIPCCLQSILLEQPRNSSKAVTAGESMMQFVVNNKMPSASLIYKSIRQVLDLKIGASKKEDSFFHSDIPANPNSNQNMCKQIATI